jgi:hypothetical protein
VTEHTPGPWDVDAELADTHGYMIRGPGHDVVVVAEGIDRLADARLIAAAPELLEALRELCSSGVAIPEPGDQRGMAALAKARAALAKCGGRA